MTTASTGDSREPPLAVCSRGYVRCPDPVTGMAYDTINLGKFQRLEEIELCWWIDRTSGAFGAPDAHLRSLLSSWSPQPGLVQARRIIVDMSPDDRHNTCYVMETLSRMETEANILEDYADTSGTFHVNAFLSRVAMY